MRRCRRAKGSPRASSSCSTGTASTATSTIRELTGVTPALSCAGGTSDGRYLARICPEVVEIGTVNATIHKVDERVKAADLETLAAIYRRLLERLLAPEG